MKGIQPTLVGFIITIVGAFVKPPVLKSISPSSAFNPLDIEDVNLNITKKPSDIPSSDPLGSPSSHRTFLDFPRTKYVDKTELIEEALLDNLRLSTYHGCEQFKQSSILITRPRGFGKTLALSSLYYFCDHSFKNATALFSGLKIMENDPHRNVVRDRYMNKFPVIWIDIGTVKYETPEKNFKEVKRIVSNIFRGYQYLLESKKLSSSDKNRFENLIKETEGYSSVQSSIPFLGECIHKYHNKLPIVLIDNYDVPFHTGYTYKFYTEIEEFMWSFYHHTIQDNSFVHRSILAGLMQIHDPTLYILKDMHVFTVLDEKFHQRFGFTDDEVRELLERSGSNTPFETLKQHYGCHYFWSNDFFNPLSVVNEIFAHKNFAWAKAEPKEPGKVIVEHGLYPLLLLQGVIAESKLRKDVENYVHLPALKTHELTYWSYLVHSGYINGIQLYCRIHFTELAIPNLEVHNKIELILKEAGETIPDNNKFTHQLILGDYAHAELFIRDYFQRAGRYFWAAEDDKLTDRVIEYVKLMLRGVENRFHRKINSYPGFEEYNRWKTLEMWSKRAITPLIRVRVKMDQNGGREEIESLISSGKTKDEILIVVEGKKVYIYAGTDIWSYTEPLEKNNN